MKIYANYSALELLLDSIERVKPILSLGSYVKSGKKTEYPVFLKAEKRRRIALQNIVKMIKSIEGQKLHQKIAEGIIDLATVTEDGKHDLAFNRDELFELISLRGENLRAAVRHLRRK
jgi:ribosomal protein S7